MRIPEKRLCDLCKGELSGPHIVMSYPLDQVDKAAIEQQFPPPPKGNFFSFMTVTPDSWRFEFCRGCSEGFMPMLAELKTQAVTTWLDERKRRSEAPIGEND